MSATEEQLPAPKPAEEGGDAGGGSASRPPAEWTVMIYMSGDNDLTHDCIRALADLKSLTGADPDNVHVIAQLDPEDRRMRTKRYVLNKKLKQQQQGGGTAPGKPGQIQKPGSGAGQPGHLKDDEVELKPGRVPFPGKREGGRAVAAAAVSEGKAEGAQPADDGEVNMAHPKTLFDFISSSVDEFPARHYMLVLDGHSAGVEEGFLMKDSNPPGSMKFADLKCVLEEVRDSLRIRLEVLGLDSCLMNMVEVCYEFRGLAEIIVGSQGLVPGRGWPFAKIIETLSGAAAATDARNLAALAIQKTMEFYAEHAAIGGLSVDVGALLVERSAAVAEEVGKLAGLLTKGLTMHEVEDGIILSHWRSQSYNGELYVDLWDFCGQMGEHCDKYRGVGDATDNTEGLLGQISEQCGKVQAAVEATVLSSCFVGAEYQHSHGLSIYFPWSEMFTGYRELGFAASGWNDFLGKYLVKTRRESRNQGDAKFRETLRKDLPWKKDPPYAGPYEIGHSMRNPPAEFPDGINCVKGGGD